MKTKRCVVCGQEFQARRKDQRQCGVACRVRAHRIRKGVGARRYRTKREGGEKAGRLFGVAATLPAVASLKRQLEQEQAERQNAVAALAQAQKTIADLGAELARVREEAVAERERGCAALAAEQQRGKKELDAERYRVLSLYNREICCRRRIEAQHEEEATALQARCVRAEKRQRLAEDNHTALLVERDELSAQLQQATQRCNQLAREKTDLHQRLVDTWQQSLHRKRLLRAACRSRNALAADCQNLVTAHQNLRGALVQEYNRALATQEQVWLRWAQGQQHLSVSEIDRLRVECNVLTAEKTRLQSEYNALHDRNTELTLERDRIKDQADRQADQLDEFKAVVNKQRRRLQRINHQPAQPDSFGAQNLVSDRDSSERSRRGRAGHQRAKSQRSKTSVEEVKSSLLESVAKVVGSTTVGGVLGSAVALTVKALASSGRKDQALSEGSKYEIPLLSSRGRAADRLTAAPRP